MQLIKKEIFRKLYTIITIREKHKLIGIEARIGNISKTKRITMLNQKPDKFKKVEFIKFNV